MSVQIETDLKDILGKIDQKLDNLQKDITELKIGQTRLEGKIEANSTKIEGLDEKFSTRIEKLDEKFSTRIEGLDEKFSTRIEKLDEKFSTKIDGLDKRLGNQEFLNRAVVVGLLLAILGGLAKLFGFVGNLP
jgi:predicted nuclease with TOPRIM domain